MIRWTPNERADYLQQIGADSPRLQRWREQSYRAGNRQVGDLGPVGELVSLYRGEDSWIHRDVLDVAATTLQQRMVYRHEVINSHCPCGREAELPADRPGDPCLCWDCDTAERNAQADDWGWYRVATRSAAADLGELIGQYDRPGGLPNTLARR